MKTEKIILLGVIDILIDMKCARYKQARGYSLNTDMRIEESLLEAEIKELREQRKHIIKQK